MSIIQIEDPKPTTKPRAAAAKSRAGRKSELERLATKAAVAKEEKRLAALEEIEASRAKLLQPDTNFTARLNDVIGFVIMGAAFLIAYFVLVDVASWMKLPWWPLTLIVPFIIELVILHAQIDFIRSESREQGSGRFPYRVMFGVLGVAVIAQGSHTISEWGSDFGGFNYESWIGLVLACASPLMIAYTSKRYAVLTFAKPQPAESE